MKTKHKKHSEFKGRLIKRRQWCTNIPLLRPAVSCLELSDVRRSSVLSIQQKYIRIKKTLFNDKHRPCDSSPAWGTPLQRYARHYSRSHPLDPTTPPSTVCSNNTCLFFCCQNTQNTTSPLHLAGSCIQNKTDSQTWASPPSAVAPADEEAKCFWSTKNAAQKKK